MNNKTTLHINTLNNKKTTILVDRNPRPGLKLAQHGAGLNLLMGSQHSSWIKTSIVVLQNNISNINHQWPIYLDDENEFIVIINHSLEVSLSQFYKQTS